MKLLAPPIGLLLVGCGPHAVLSYLPVLRRLQREYPVSLKAVVELEGKESATWTALGSDFGKVECLFTPPFTDKHKLPAKLAAELDRLVARHQITGIIIATEPRAHMQYALWAISKGLHVLLDKPISAYEQIIDSPERGKLLKQDFEILSANRQPDKAFVINTERRYRHDFRFVFDRLEETARQHGIPVTAMYSSHADGQWRLPHEIPVEDYHGYNAGMGKISHGGYHIADITSEAVRRSFTAAGKSFDEVGVYTSPIRPAGLLRQQSKDDYVRTFGRAYAELNRLSDQQLAERFKRFGEVDASSVVTLYDQKDAVANLIINLTHNSFSRRSWLKPNRDLYKGNGRVRHEHYNIQQGPYQNIQIHAYHSDQERPTSTEHDFKLGGNEHFDIFIFRNSGLMGGKPLEIVGSQDILPDGHKLPNTVLQEAAKHKVVREFLEIMSGRLKPAASLSDLATHGLTATLMSLMCQSGSKDKAAKAKVEQPGNPVPVKRPGSRPFRSSLYPHVRILGADVTGKTLVTEALKKLSPEAVTFGSTQPYVYEWLRASGVGEASELVKQKVNLREQIYMQVNEQEAAVVNDILGSRPVVAIRGRADTLLTHAALKDKPMPNHISKLFPEGMRPDLLVVLGAPLKVIEERLDERGESKTGANSLDFEAKCLEMYDELAVLAGRYMPVLTFDTSDPKNPPDVIAKQVEDAMRDLMP